MKQLIRAGIAYSCIIAGVTIAPVVFAKGEYQCDNTGRVMYGDACEPAPKAKMPAHQPLSTTSAPSPEAAKLAKQYDAEAARDSAAKRKADAAWLKQHDAEKARQAAIDKGLAEHRIVKGMTPEQVRSVLNQPDRIEDQGGLKERWVYNEAGHHRHVVTFKDGVVASDSERASKHK